MENPLWGAPRIHGELLKLGFEIAESTVSKYMIRRRKAVPYVDMSEPKHWLQAFADRAIRDEIESGMYEHQRRNCYTLDPDIAVHRSFSRMAKLTFQRGYSMGQMGQRARHG
jgi:hypothetical protein